MQKKITVLLLLIFIHQAAAGSNKPNFHALLIGISEYRDKAWSRTAGTADCRVMKQMLTGCGFSEKNIITLSDRDASYQGILRKIQELIDVIHAGDVVVIYYSGHGNTLSDDNGDEEDQIDEAIAPYDAPKVVAATANDQNYIRDDTIDKWIRKFTAKLEKDGHLLFIFDSCYSGEANRNGRITLSKGGDGFFSESTTRFSEKTDPQPHDLPDTDEIPGSPWVFMAACQADEYARHTPDEGISIFTQALLDAFSSGYIFETYHELEKAINESMSRRNAAQTPWLRGHLQSSLLAGAYSPMPMTCRITHAEGTSVRINGMALLHAKTGGKVVFYDEKEVRDTTGKQPYLVGRIEKLELPYAKIKLDAPFPEEKRDQFIVGMLRGDHRLNFDFQIIAPPGKMNELRPLAEVMLQEKYLRESRNPNLLLQLSENSDSLRLLTLSHLNVPLAVFPFKQTTDYDLQQKLLYRLRLHAGAEQLRRLKSTSETCDIQIQLSRDSLGKEIVRASEKFKTDDLVWLNIKNNSGRKIYFNIIEIYETDSVGMVYPDISSGWRSSDCVVESGQTNSFSIQLTPAFERSCRDFFKVIATDFPFDWSKELKEATRGHNNYHLPLYFNFKATLQKEQVRGGLTRNFVPIDIEDTVQIIIEH